MRSAIVLAGGRAERAQGMEKYFFEYRGRTFIETLIEAVSNAVDEIIVVARDEAQCRRFTHLKGIRCVEDIRKGIGPIGGLHAGVTHAKGEIVFVTACDMPFIKGEVIRYLFDLIEGYDAVVPCWDRDRLEPLHAVYRRDAVAEYLNKQANTLSLRGMIRALCTRFVHVSEIRRIDPMLTSFVNINRPEELKGIEALKGPVPEESEGNFN